MPIQEKYVVCRPPYAGWGDHFRCLAGSWWYARETGRTLVIDWRGSRFMQDPSEDLFDSVFDLAKRQIGGVDLVVGPAPAEAMEGAFFWDKWTPDSLVSTDYMSHTTDEVVAMNNLIQTGVDRPEKCVVFNQFLNIDLQRPGLEELTNALRFNREICQRADAFFETRVELAQTRAPIAIHLRHGNGENLGDRVAYWLSPIDCARQVWRNEKNDMHRDGISGRFADNMPDCLTANPGVSGVERNLYKRISDLCDRFQQQEAGSADSPVVLFTDATRVVTGLQSVIPELLRYESDLVPDGQGPLHYCKTHQGATDFDALKRRTTQMLVEQEIMRRCQHLICIESGFTAMARAVMKPENVHLLRAPMMNRAVCKLVRRIA